MRFSVILVLLALLTTACGGPSRTPDVGSQAPDDEGAVGDPDPDDPVSGPDGEELPSSDDDGGTRLALPEAREIRDGVRDATPRPFESALSDETDGSLHVIYWTGVEPCAVLGGIEVDAGDERVTVTLLEGHLPDDDGQAPVCIEIAEQVSARVPLDEPLGDRTLIDGATGEPVPVDVVKMSDAAAS